MTNKLSRAVLAATLAVILAGLMGGCTGDNNSDPTPMPTMSLPSGSGTPSASSTTGVPTGISDPTGEESEPGGDTPVVDPADPQGGGDWPDDGGMTLPDVAPAPAGDTFCSAYMKYLNAGGPYTIMDSGDNLPVFTQADMDAYLALQASAPADIKAQIDTVVGYAKQLLVGDFTNAIEYENLMTGPKGLVLYAIVYCQVDTSII